SAVVRPATAVALSAPSWLLVRLPVLSALTRAEVSAVICAALGPGIWLLVKAWIAAVLRPPTVVALSELICVLDSAVPSAAYWLADSAPIWVLLRAGTWPVVRALICAVLRAETSVFDRPASCVLLSAAM